ncbi:MAG: AAA family ATPase [Pseudomonadota bacterium]
MDNVQGSKNPAQTIKLAEWQGEGLSIGVALDLAAQLAAELGLLHEQNVLHTHVDLEHVEVDKRSETLKLRSPAQQVTIPAGGMLPAATNLVGSVQSAAPEMTGRLNRPIDFRADLYSAGVVIYFMLTGRVPFAADSQDAVLHAHLARMATPPAELNPAIPGALSDLVMRLLDKDPEQRYSNALSLAADLQSLKTLWLSAGNMDQFELGRQDQVHTFQVSRRLVGREEPLAELNAAAEQCRWGRSGSVWVGGPPGIGKSVLISELRKDMQPNCLFVSGKYEQYRRSIAYSAFVTAFEEAIQRLLTRSDAELNHLQQRLLRDVGPNLQLVVDVLPNLVHITGPLAALPELPPAEERNRFNSTVVDFVRSFASAEQPIILFLDDLQWADISSLTLMELLLKDHSIQHLLILGAYRSNEVDSAHPLSMTLSLLTDAGVRPKQISLGGLTAHQVTELVSDSVSRSIDECAELGLLLTERTAGNPFYVGQFLRVLHEREILYSVPNSKAWAWDMQEIHQASLPADATEFVADRLDTFPGATCEALKTAACLGTVFKADALGKALSRTADDIRNDLAPAVRAGFVEPRAQGYGFVHDRIQQAAFDLIPAAGVAAFRYRIGNVALTDTSPEGLEDVVFELLDNLNFGVELDLAQAERTNIARLNLLAAQQARASLAYDDAVRLLRIGISLLPEDAWQSEEVLTRDMEVLCFECEYLAGQYESALQRLHGLTTHVQDELRIADIHYTQVLIETSVGAFTRAVEVGRSALANFDVTVPDNPSQLQIFWELVKSRVFLGFKKISSLENLPPLEDERKRMVAQLLLSYCPAAYFHNPNVMILSALRIVNMSLRYGNPPGAAFGYVLMALVLGAALGRFKSGYEFGQVAVKLAEQTGDVSLHAKVVQIFGGFVEFWTQPIDVAVERLRSHFRFCVDAGDHQYANYSAQSLQYLAFFRGTSLVECEENAERYGPFHELTQDPFAVHSYRSLRQTVLALRGKTSGPDSLDTEHWIEHEERDKLAANPTTFFYYQVWKMQLLYRCGELHKAQALAEITTVSYDNGVSQICQVEQALYSGLVAVGLLRTTPAGSDEDKYKKQHARAQSLLAKWARACPQNFACAAQLLEAEVKSLAGAGDTAMVAYDAVIKAAQEGGFLNLVAIANERAAEIYAAAGRQAIAQAYYGEAINTNLEWGAVAKAAQLAEISGIALPQEQEHALQQLDRAQISNVDVSSLIRATEAITSEDNLDAMLRTMVRVTMEVAGAERCAVLLDERDIGWCVRALGNVAEDSADIVQQNLDDRAPVCAPAVQFAVRTSRPLSVADARMDDRFNQSPYVVAQQPVSMLALPLQRQGRVVGAIYLENNLTADAFATDKLKGLEIVASELAMALENVRLTAQQQSRSVDLQDALQKVEFLQQAKGHLSKFVPQSVQRIIDENPYQPALGKSQRDLSVLFLDIAGYTRMSESLEVSQIDYLVERYFSAFLGDIHANGGDINETAGDGLMILFQQEDQREHAQHAARTALAIRDRTREINAELGADEEPVSVNIGINSGAALVGSTQLQSSGGVRFTYTATGMVTNLAARIAASAIDGEILTSADTAQRLDATFEVVSVGAREFKNVSSAVEVYKLIR